MEDREAVAEENIDTGNKKNEKSDSDTTIESEEDINFSNRSTVERSTMNGLKSRYREIISSPCLLIRRAKGHLYSHLGNPVDKVNSTS